MIGLQRSYTPLYSSAAADVYKGRTCNPVELYWGSSHEDKIATQEAIERFLSEFHRVGLRTIQEHFKVRHDGQAVEHLFTVVSSIDSLVVGESQIPAQVRSAYDRSKLEGAAGAVMHSLFQHANQVSKRVTTRLLYTSDAADE